LGDTGITEVHTWGVVLGSDQATCTTAAGLGGLAAARTYSIVGAVLASDSKPGGAVLWTATANHGDWLNVLANLDDRAAVELVDGRVTSARAAVARLLGADRSA
jgi:mannitol-specific phosphotransferase system IIBC component